MVASLLASAWAVQAQSTGQNLTVKVNNLTPLTSQASLQAAIANAIVDNGLKLSDIKRIEVQDGTFAADDWYYLQARKKDTLSSLTSFKIDVAGEIPNSNGTNGAYFSNKLVAFRAQSITKIGSYAFMNCNALDTIEVPAVTAVEQNAFSSCTGLRSIEFGHVETVGKNAFAGCSKLTHASLGVQTLNSEVFKNCSALASVELLNVAMIYNAFAGCEALTTLKFGDVPTINANNIATIFQNCPSVRYLEVADAKKADYRAVNDGNTSDDLWYALSFSTRAAAYR